MTKKKDKEFIKKPDVFLTSFNSVTEFIRKYSKQTIAGVIILLIALGIGYAYMLHLDSQSDRMQRSLMQGIQSFNDYGISGKQEDLTKAETIFKEISLKKVRDTGYIAKLYLAKIQYIRGRNEEASRLYREVFKDTSNNALKKIAEKALQHIGEK